MKISQIDHFVLVTDDLEACIHFYKEILGLEHRLDHGQHTFHFGNQKINIHTRIGEFQPAAMHAGYGSQDFCLIVQDDIYDVKKEIEEKNWPLIEGVVTRYGARGQMKSIYMYDPDGNLVELAQYAE